MRDESAGMNHIGNVTLRKFTPADVDGIVNLMNTVFKPEEFTVDWWKWKYVNNPNGFWGEEGDIWLAEDQNKIVGYYAVIPFKMKYYSSTLAVAQSVDTATHLNYRGMGIFSRLAKNVYAAAKERYTFLFGFPSIMSHGGFIKFGWIGLSPASNYQRIYNYDVVIKETVGDKSIVRFGKPILKAYAELKRFSTVFSSRKINGGNVEVEETTRFDDDIDAFWECARRDLSVVVERTKAFLNWRFSSHFGNYRIFVARSVNEGDIVGYMVLRKRVNSLDIIDLVTLPRQGRAVLELIENALSIAKTEGVSYVSCRFPKWHENAVLLRKVGFVSMFPILPPMMRSIPRLRKNYPNPAILYDFGSGVQLPNDSDWFCTSADTDVA
jgi:GNAT superfamily N-acetyltransferase